MILITNSVKITFIPDGIRAILKLTDKYNLDFFFNATIYFYKYLLKSLSLFCFYYRAIKDFNITLTVLDKTLIIDKHIWS